jgi:hypothetical protein
MRHCASSIDNPSPGTDNATDFDHILKADAGEGAKYDGTKGNYRSQGVFGKVRDFGRGRGGVAGDRAFVWADFGRE